MQTHLRADIHPTAIIADGAEFGDGVAIGPYAIVGSQVRLGDRCRVGSHAVIEGDTWLGEDCIIYPKAILGTPAQDKKLSPDAPAGKLRMGARNRIREFVTINCGTPHGGGVTKIGDDNMFLAASHIGHDCLVGNGSVFTNLSLSAGHVVFEDGALLGAGVGIHQFCRVGSLAMVGAGSMVTKDVSPYAVIQGDRARLRGINLIGLKRAGFSPDRLRLIKQAYRELCWRQSNLKDRLAKVREIAGKDPAILHLADFVEVSKRGIVMPKGDMEEGDEGAEA